ncbi:MAG TPA: ABC transporter permease [Sandaracinaceae bacterium LLY-WYZ-13_1]|nr:ABC transporter permease [Sandaracinaceae bacterium LLY-WYZ-13_1]
MSAPPAPSFFGATGAVSRLSLLRTLRGRKVRVASVAVAVVILFPAVVALVKEDAETAEVVRAGIDWGFFRLLVFLLPILFVSGVVSEEVEGRTLHYLAMRPVPRASIALGKYAVGTLSALGILWAGLLLLHLVGFAASPSLLVDELGATVRAGGAASLLLMNYCAICLFWGTLVPEAAGLLSVVWLGFIEWFLLLLPGVVRFVSMAHFARELGGLDRPGWDVLRNPLTGQVVVQVPDVELWVCGTVIGAEWILFLGLSLLIMQVSQLRFGKA